jgi:hypothetical protein
MESPTVLRSVGAVSGLRIYRSPEYQQMRHASEPWYTAKFNFELASPGSYDLRRKIIEQIFRSHIGDRPIKRVMDYGGDRGDLVVGLVKGAEAFVYDISGIPPLRVSPRPPIRPSARPI